MCCWCVSVQSATKCMYLRGRSIFRIFELALFLMGCFVFQGTRQMSKSECVNSCANLVTYIFSFKNSVKLLGLVTKTIGQRLHLHSVSNLLLAANIKQHCPCNCIHLRCKESKRTSLVICFAAHVVKCVVFLLNVQVFLFACVPSL